MESPRPVFISYSRTDRSYVEQLAEQLKAHGVEVWFDKQIAPGNSWTQEIQDRLSNASLVLFVVTPASITSENVLNELTFAENKRIVPLMLKEAKLPLAVIRRQWIDATHGRNAVADILEVLGHSPQPNKPLPANRTEPFALQTERGRIGGLMLGLVGLLLAPMFFLPQPSRRGPELTRLLDNHCWVAYDPQDYDPDKQVFPTTASLQRDLQLIREAGFTGVVTFSSRETLAEIPALAKAEGLSVIMGVWNPYDPYELANARREAAYVDAYCVGHRYNIDETIEQLERVIPRLRQRTGRPVTTTSFKRDYASPRLCEVGDWLFPDFHLDLTDGPADEYRVNVGRDLEMFKTSIFDVAALAQKYERPLMVKTLVYPWAQAADASEESQRRFFRGVLDVAYDAHQGPPTQVSFSFHCAFDCPWKSGNNLFPVWDAYSGLLRSDGSLRPAGEEIVKRWKR